MADMIVHQIVNLFDYFAFIDQYEASEEKRHEEYKIFTTKSIPNYLEKLENFVQERDTQYVVTDSITYADICLVSFFDNFGPKKDTLFYPFKSIKRIDEEVCLLPQIKKWRSRETKNK